MLQDFFVRIVGEHPVWQALAGGLVIAGLNMLGATLVLFWRNPPERLMNAGLGVAAGVMLSASFTSLILPGIDAGGIWPVIAGMLLGMLVIDQADRWVPHVHVLITGQVDEARSESRRVKSVLLFIVAITLHNLPEGLAVGVSFGAGNLADALTLMLAIGLQNIPEGLAVSLAAVNAGFSRRTYAFLTGVRAGLVEIPVAVLGALAVTVFEPLVPYAMGFAAGAMLYVISDEVIPETHASGDERLATWGVMLGAIVMLYLDVTLG